jgi:hypothetical protein
MWTIFRTRSGGSVAADFQLVIDCADPEPLARSWAAVLGYAFEPLPAGFARGNEFDIS